MESLHRREREKERRWRCYCWMRQNRSQWTNSTDKNMEKKACVSNLCVRTNVALQVFEYQAPKSRPEWIPLDTNANSWWKLEGVPSISFDSWIKKENSPFAFWLEQTIIAQLLASSVFILWLKRLLAAPSPFLSCRKYQVKQFVLKFYF